MDCTLSDSVSSEIQVGTSKLPVEHRVKLVYLYSESGYNAEEAARRFNNIYGADRLISSRFVRRIVDKFNETGSVQDGRIEGRPKRTIDEAFVHRVIEEAESEANIGLNKIAQRCNTSR